MSTLRAKFGHHLRLLRRQKGLTQEQLAEATNLSVEFVSNMERGINAPSFETLSKLAEVLEIPVKTLFEFQDE